jgi:hypothetical protein
MAKSCGEARKGGFYMCCVGLVFSGRQRKDYVPSCIGFVLQLKPIELEPSCVYLMINPSAGKLIVFHPVGFFFSSDKHTSSLLDCNLED